MALEKAYCANHSERLAIGVCVETGRAICGECSTRYNGVNYSREGLEIMLARKREKSALPGRLGWRRVVMLGVPVSVLLYLIFLLFGEWLMLWLRG
ncbi:MAG: hypothetical protein LBJ46_11555 [Planctomycetota bacterium]|nr:hypothetical protein [Planctomycetota bacterium]